MTDSEKVEYAKREIAARERFIREQEERFARRDFAPLTAKQLYREIDSGRRALRRYIRRTAHLTTG